MRSRIFSLFLTVLVLVGASACHATFDANVTAQTKVQGGGLFQNLVSNAFGDFSSIDLSQSSDFKNAGISKDQVESVKLTGLTLKIVSPASGSFEFMDAVAFYVEADGLPKKKVAEKKDIPNDAKTVTLDLTDEELAPYVTAPKMSLTTDATAHAPQQDTTIQADAVFTVDPKVF